MARLIRPFGPSAAVVMLALLLLSPTAAAAAAPRLLGLDLLAPIGRADAYSTAFQTTRVVAAPGVLANDTDPEGSSLSAQFVSGPANGTLSLAANGGFQYQPDAGFSGADTFRYRPSDGFAHLIPAGTVTVTITVAAPTPTPTPTPTPPTPKPTATPSPTPTPTLPPLPIPTPTLPPLPIPTPTLPPLPIPTPTLPPLPIATPTPPPLPLATPIPTPGATLPVIPTASPTPGPSGAPGPTPAASGGPGASSGPSGQPDPSPDPSVQPGPGVVVGGGGPTDPGGLDLPPILERQAGPISFGSFGGFGLGIEWIIPTAVFTLPGFLLLLIGLAQVFGGFVWLPLARRSLRGDGRPAPAGTNRIPNA